METGRMPSRHGAVKRRHEGAPDAGLAGIPRDTGHRYYHEAGEPIGRRED